MKETFCPDTTEHLMMAEWKSPVTTLQREMTVRPFIEQSASGIRIEELPLVVSPAAPWLSGADGRRARGCDNLITKLAS